MKLTHEFCAAQTLPFTAYDTKWNYDGEGDGIENLIGFEVVPVTVTRYGTNPGATNHTIDYIHESGQTYVTTVDLFHQSRLCALKACEEEVAGWKANELEALLPKLLWLRREGYIVDVHKPLQDPII